VQSNDVATCYLAGNHGRQRKNNDSKHHPSVYYSNSIRMTEWSPVLSSSTLTPVLTRESLISAGPFVTGLKCSGNVFRELS
jgi:hypothetical protein